MCQRHAPSNAPEPHLDLVGLAARQRALPAVGRGRQVVGMHDSPPAGAVERARRGARVGVDLVVEPVEMTVRRRRPDMVGHRPAPWCGTGPRWRAAVPRRASAPRCRAPCRRSGWRRRLRNGARPVAAIQRSMPSARPIVRYSTSKGERWAGSRARCAAWSILSRSSGCRPARNTSELTAASGGSPKRARQRSSHSSLPVSTS